MKKTLALILTLVLIMALCVSAIAAESDFKHMPDYFAAGKYSGSDVDIVVPASIGGQPTPILYTDSIGSSAVKAMVSLTISDGVTQLRDNNTYGANVLKKVVLPDTLEVIGRRNFYQADALTEITIPASVAYVGQECFSYCNVLTKVTFTGPCPTFGANCFKDPAADLVIYVPDDQLDAYKAQLAAGLNIQPSGKKAVASRAAVSESDFAFDASTGAITGYTGTVGCIEIPATIGGVQVKAIGKEALTKNPFVVVVTLPEGLETIELSAFAGAPALARVNFPSTLKAIGKYAFNGVKLDQLVLPEGLETIGDSAFTTAFGQNKIAEIVIPNTVTTIGKKAFNANKAARIVFGESVQTVGGEAFASSSALTEIVILNKNMITFAGDAFTKCTTDATLTLADGISQDVYNEYLTLIPMLFPTCTVIEPENMEMPFPTLDVMAGMPFFGTWNAVAGKDVMGEFTDEYPTVTATLNPDGTAAVRVNGEDKPSAWYVMDGYAILAPVVDRKADTAGAYGFANIDENGRLVIDLGYAAAICEQEGRLYTVPAVPEKPWPEFNLDNAKYFIGIWQTAGGEMILTLNDDGTATSAEMGEKPYALQWYADYGTAYVGPTMRELAKITFDGNGNIKMSMGGDEIVLAPYVEKTLIEGADELLGDWYDDIGTKLTLGNDGVLTLTYDDGYAREMTWDMVDGRATVTGDIWEGCPITFDGLILTITNGEGIFQIFSRDGDLSAYYGEETYELSEATPIGAEGDPYFGTWAPAEIIMDGQSINAQLIGMMMEVELNPDGTITFMEDGEFEIGTWSVVDGAAVVDDMALTLNEKGQLVLEDEEMTILFDKHESDAEVSEEEALLALLAMMGDLVEYEMNTGEASVPEHLLGYLGEWHMVYMSFGGMSGHPKQVLGLDSVFTVNADGTASIGFPIDKNGSWYEEDGNVYFGEEGMPLTLLSDGCLQYGSQLGGYFVFSKDPDATWAPTAGQAMTLAPGISNIPGTTAAAQSAGFARMEDRLEKKFVAKSYTSFGQTMDASMLGAEYAVTFHENGLADFTLAGTTIQSLPWGLQKVPVGLSTVDAFSINYYGTMFNAALTDAGFDMDYYGTMTLHFVLAE